MVIPKNGWGSPSMSDDIFNNLGNTHHKEKIYDNSLSKDVMKGLLDDKYERPFEEKLVRNNNIDYQAVDRSILSDNYFADKSDYSDDDFEYDDDSFDYSFDDEEILS